MDETGEVLPFRAAEGVEVRHLRSFVAVAEELNFSRAAERLYLSQPALSRQIRTLERVVGCELLRRSTHRVELTLAGAALLDRARAVLALVLGEDPAILYLHGGNNVLGSAYGYRPLVCALVAAAQTGSLVPDVRL